MFECVWARSQTKLVHPLYSLLKPEHFQFQPSFSSAKLYVPGNSSSAQLFSGVKLGLPSDSTPCKHCATGPTTTLPWDAVDWWWEPNSCRTPSKRWSVIPRVHPFSMLDGRISKALSQGRGICWSKIKGQKEWQVQSDLVPLKLDKSHSLDLQFQFFARYFGYTGVSI